MIAAGFFVFSSVCLACAWEWRAQALQRRIVRLEMETYCLRRSLAQAEARLHGMVN